MDKTYFEDNRVLSFLLSQTDVLSDIGIKTIDTYTFQDVFITEEPIVGVSGTFENRDLVITTAKERYTFSKLLRGIIRITKQIEKNLDTFYVGNVRFTGAKDNYGENQMWLEGVYWTDIMNILGCSYNEISIGKYILRYDSRSPDDINVHSYYRFRQQKLQEFARYVTMDPSSEVQAKRIMRCNDPGLKFVPPDDMVNYLQEGGFYDDAQEFLKAYLQTYEPEERHSEFHDTQLRDFRGRSLREFYEQLPPEDAPEPLHSQFYDSLQRVMNYRTRRLPIPFLGRQVSPRQYLPPEGWYGDTDGDMIPGEWFNPQMSREHSRPQYRAQHIRQANEELVHRYIMMSNELRFLPSLLGEYYFEFVQRVAYIPQRLNDISLSIISAYQQQPEVSPRQLFICACQYIEQLLDS